MAVERLYVCMYVCMYIIIIITIIMTNIVMWLGDVSAGNSR